MAQTIFMIAVANCTSKCSPKQKENLDILYLTLVIKALLAHYTSHYAEK